MMADEIWKSHQEKAKAAFLDLVLPFMPAEPGGPSYFNSDPLTDGTLDDSLKGGDGDDKLDGGWG